MQVKARLSLVTFSFLFESLVNGLPVGQLLASGALNLSVLLPGDGVPLRGLGDASSAPPQTEQASLRS